MKVYIKKLSEEAIIPTKATSGSAAYDLYIPRDTHLIKRRELIPLDLAIEMPNGYEAKIEPRSGFSLKGIEDINHKRIDADVLVGKIDSDYRGNIGVIIKTNKYAELAKGTRIAQLTFYKVEDADFKEVEHLGSTDRGDGGFGHSGIL